MELPHWIVRHGKDYALCIEPEQRERVLAALSEFEADEAARVEERKAEPFQIPKLAVALTTLAMAAFYKAQLAAPTELLQNGIADDLLIRSGQWWRCFTALTLHGDSDHLFSNLSLAIFAFAIVYGRLGVGFGLLGTIIGGALGNALNSIAHLAEAHRSLGSSTALFAALGLLSGVEIAARLRGKTRTRWPLIVPIGAAVAFLGLFGGSGGTKHDGTPIPIGRIDLGAHLFGIAAGVLVGAVFYFAGVHAGTSKRAQCAAGLLAVTLLATAWLLASRM